MTEPHDDYVPDPKFLEALPDMSGNDLNGLGETEPRAPSLFFWHPHSKQPFGDLQDAVLDHHRQSEPIRATYSPKAPRGPRPVEQAPLAIEKMPRPGLPKSSNSPSITRPIWSGSCRWIRPTCTKAMK